MAEHRISYLWNLADRTVVLKDGQIVRELSREQMDKISEEELHALGHRSANKYCHPELVSGSHIQEMLKQVQHDESDISNFLTLQNFRYKYRNGYQALNIPQMQILVGKITAITGNNGDGKTTLLNCLCGLGRRSKGTLLYNGKTVIVVTHDRELIKECCDQEISLHDFNQI